MREASYTSLRIGLYEPAKKWTGADQKGAGLDQNSQLELLLEQLDQQLEIHLMY